MKDKNIAAILAFFLGSFGAHKFYLGQMGWGLMYLLFSWTFVPAFLAFIEFIFLALMDEDEFNRRFNGRYTLGGNPVVLNMLPPSGYPAGYPGAGRPRTHGAKHAGPTMDPAMSRPSHGYYPPYASGHPYSKPSPGPGSRRRASRWARRGRALGEAQ